MDAANRLQWVNRGSNTAPTAGQASPYTLFSHDSNGRISRRERRHDGGLLRAHDFVWDSQNRLQEVKEGATTKLTADYNGGGLRTAKWDAWTGQHDYSWGPGGVLHDSSGNTTYTPGLGHRSNGVDRCYHEDRHGSTRYMSDSTGNSFPTALRYDAYGQRSATSGPAHPSDMLFGAEAGYQTEYADGSDPGLGLQYIRQRYYDPAVGRFLTPDPIGFAAGLNRNGYGHGDPVNGRDRSGMLWETLIDVGVTLYDAYNYAVNPTEEGLQNLAADAAGLLLPFVPSAALRQLDNVADALNAVDDVAPALRSADDIPAPPGGEYYLNPPGGGLPVSNDVSDTVTLYRGFRQPQLDMIRASNGVIGEPPLGVEYPRLWVTPDYLYAQSYGEVWETQVPTAIYEEARDVFGLFQGSPVEEIAVPYMMRHRQPGYEEFFTGWTPSGG